MKFQYIAEYRGVLTRSHLCRLMGVTDRGFRAWKQRPPSQRQRRDMVILAHIGPAKHTVTTNLNINFMHKAAPGPIVCTGRLLKLGKQLAVVEATITDEEGTIVAHATATYSIPPGRKDTVK